MSEKKPLKKGQGRREFLACIDRIRDLAAQGYDIGLTYQKLIEEGLITMTYSGFYENYTRRRQKKKNQDGNFNLEPSLPLFPQSNNQPQLQPVKAEEVKPIQQNVKPMQISAKAPAQDAQPEKVKSGKSIQEILSLNVKAAEQFATSPSSEDDSEYAELKTKYNED